MTMDDPGWPKLQLLFDAKYRIDTTQRYKEQYRLLLVHRKMRLMYFIDIVTQY